MSAQKHTEELRALALSESFDFCQISQAAYLEEEAPKLEKWLKNKYQGGMDYMERNFDLRLDPRKLVPDAKSVIVLAMNYHTPVQETTPRVSMYASGRDYHKVIKKKLKRIISQLQITVGDFAARGFVDSAPVLERAWAVRSGLGFVGKNGNLIIPRAGSYFFLATIICDLELVYDPPFATDHCGDCTLCIDACPTDAILSGKEIDGSRCISYYSIETKNNEWENENPNLDSWLFGCDICQTVCPWNRFSKDTLVDDFQRKTQLQNWTYADWENLSESEFDAVFQGSPLKRKGYEGIKSTLEYLRRNNYPPEKSTG